MDFSQFSRSVTSETLRPHGLQHARLPVHQQLQSLLKLMSIESVMPSNHLILYCPFLLPPSVFPRIRVFSNKSILDAKNKSILDAKNKSILDAKNKSILGIRWPKYWSFSFNISSSNEYSGLISFRMDWLDLLAVQGTLKSLLRHHKQSINSLVLSFL